MIRWLLTSLAVLLASAAPASAAWLPATELAAGDAPSLAVARDGTAFVAFEHSDGANTRVAVAMRSPGGAFGPARDLSAPGRNAFSPALAVDRAGGVTLAWSQGDAFVVQARYRPPGGDWSEATPPLSLGPIARGPAVAVGDDGAAVVAWSRGNVVEAAARGSAAEAFGPALTVSAPAIGGICQAPRAAMSPAGDATLLWTRRTSVNGDFHVESSTKAAGAAAWMPFTPRSTTAGNSDCNTDVATTPDGRTSAIWDFTEPGQQSFVSLSGTTISTPGVRSIRPVLAVGDDGDTVAAWMAEGKVVSFQRGVLKPLSGATELSGLAIGASPAGEAQVAFVGQSNGADALFAARRTPGGPFGDVDPVAPSAPGVDLALPDVALDDQGNALAVWVSRVGTTASVQLAVFDGVPPTLDAVDVPPTGVAGSAVGMSAAAADRGSPVSLSFDFGDGSSAAGGSVAHAYAAAGTYTVTVTATDGGGNRVSAARTIAIAPAPVIGVVGPGRPRNVIALVSGSWDRLANGRTRMLELAVNELEGPETVRLACTGKGCRKSARRTVTRHKRTVNFKRAVRGMVLRPKAKLTVTVSRPSFNTRVITYTMRAHKNPKKVVGCRPVGAKKLRAC